jgi:endoglucanase
MKSSGLASRMAWLSLLAAGFLLSCNDSETPAGPAAGGTATGAGGGASPGSGGSPAAGGAPSTGSSSTAGGNPATGGTSSGGFATGGKATGGTATGGQSTGGTTAAGGGSMRDISSMDLVKEMKLGWNLGNTMDSTSGGETGWGNPMTTQAMIDAVKARGFNTVRIPVTWDTHMGAAPNYTIDTAWLNRVEVIVNYVLNDGMYAIVNTHHDNWVSLMPTADQAAISDRLVKLWTQIANRFKNYDDHLVFETLNEPRTTDSTQWNGGTPAARTILNGYNAAAVNAIRATGGNNALRHIMIPTHAATPSDTCINALVIPNGDARIIVSLHTYYPNSFSMSTTGATTWGTTAERTAMATELDRIYNLLGKNGRAVIIGEWGSINKNNTAARVAHAEAYAADVRARGMLPIWWDNGVGTSGGFGLLNRSALTWFFPEIADALARGAASVP